MSLIVSTSHGIATLTLDRPPVNALDLAALADLQAALDAHDPDTPLIITGAGRSFCAGGDTRAFAGYTQAQRQHMVRAITGVMAALLAVRAPVVAAVNGHPLGSGFALMLCADWRLAGDGDHRFGLVEARAGLALPAGALAVAQHDIPAPLLRQMALSAVMLGVADLRSAGLIDDVVAPDQLAAAAISRALSLAALPGFAVLKQQVRGGLAARLAGLAGCG